MKLALVLLLGVLAVCAIAQPEAAEKSHVLQKRRFRLRRALHKVEKAVRPVAKPILQGAAGAAITKGVVAVGLGKRDSDTNTEVQRSKRRHFRLRRALDTGWRADKYRRRRPNQKRDTEEVQRSKRRFRLRRALHKVEKAVRPVGKPILEGAAGAAITKGVIAAGLGKRDADAVQRSKRRWRIRRTLHKIEHNLRPVAKPILEGAGMAAGAAAVAAAGKKRDVEGVQRSKRRFRVRRALHKVEKAVRPVGKPILEAAAAKVGADAAAAAIAAGKKRDVEEVQRSKRRFRLRRVVQRVVVPPRLPGGLGKRNTEEVQRSKRRFRLRRALHKIEKAVRPVGKPILQGAAGAAITKGVVAVGLGKRDTDTNTEVQRSKRRHFRLRRALDTGWRADKYRRRRPNQKRDTEEVQRSKRRFRLRRALHKVEKAVRPVGKPILEGAAGAAITKGVIAAGLGKRDTDEVKRSKRRWRIRRTLHKIEHNLRPVAKPILEGAGMAAGAAAVAAAGKKRDVEEVQRSKRRFRVRRALHKVEKAVRPVGKPILEAAAAKVGADAAAAAIAAGKKRDVEEVQRSKRRFRLRRVVQRVVVPPKLPGGLGKRDTEEVQRSKRRFRLRRALHKIEKAVRPVGKPILQGAAGAAITKGVVAVGLGKRDTDTNTEVQRSKRRHFRLRRALDTGWRADKYRRRRPNQKRDTEEVQRSKRRFRLRRALHKIEKAVRPVGKPILEGAAGAAITKGVVAVGLGKRDANEVQRSKRRFRVRKAVRKVIVPPGLGKRDTETVQRSKRRFRLRRALHKVEKAVRPVGKPILQGAAGAAITKGVVAVGLGKREVERSERSNPFTTLMNSLRTTTVDNESAGKTIVDSAIGYPF